MTKQDDLFDDPPDETEDGRPSGMRQRAPKGKGQPNPMADRLRVHHEGWVIGMCEGAAAFRKRLLNLLDKWTAAEVPVASLLADIGEIDVDFRRRFPEEYDRQLQIRTKDP